MDIIPLKYAESVLPESEIFENGDKNKNRDIVFKVYLIKADERIILVDAGCETMPGFVMKNFCGTLKALENINIFPNEITDVIITHAHHDHIECVKYFENAVIHIEKNEYESARNYIPQNFKVNVFCDEFSIFKNLKIIKIGGHTKGSCIVEVKTDDKIYVISGDECYLRECLIKKIPTGSSYNKDASKSFIEIYSGKEYDVLLCHDK